MEFKKKGQRQGARKDVFQSWKKPFTGETRGKLAKAGLKMKKGGVGVGVTLRF